jgi:hypothetical protein
MYGLDISSTEGDRDPGTGECTTGERYVLAGVTSLRLDDDRGLRDAECHRVLGIVDGLAAREPGSGGGAVAAGEHQHGEQARVVQVRGEHSHAQVVAAQADRCGARPRTMVHLVVVPDDLRVSAMAIGNSDAVPYHVVSSAEVAGMGRAAWSAGI